MKKYKNNKKLVRVQKTVGISVLSIVFLYLLLLIPESRPTIPDRSASKPFLWNQDSLWNSLEKQFIKARQIKCKKLSSTINKSLLTIQKLIDTINSKSLQPDDKQFRVTENALFNLAPLVGACPNRLKDYINIFTRIRNIVKTQSIHWDMNSVKARQTIYRLLYGGRGAIEEVMLQADQGSISPLIDGYAEPSKTPSSSILGVTIHSGDILISRGGSPTSALIARGNDFQGNFSHVALVHVDEKTHLASIVESHIERGVIVATLNEYLKDKKLRVMILRIRADHPKLLIDPMLPHKAATAALNEAMTRRIPYDFEMNYQEHSKLFCSEVASAPYKKLGINLWMGISRISSPGIMRWLSYFGVKNFETQEPSDLEYDPQLRVVAEWRDPDTLFKDHIDNAVVEVMIERAETGKDLEYAWYLLPFSRIAKLYSSILNTFGVKGPIPAGMSATAGLRYKRFTDDHTAIKGRVESMAIEFKKQNGYRAPYWQLLELSRKAMAELNY